MIENVLACFTLMALLLSPHLAPRLHAEHST
jgi:hypothetical protein